MTFIQRVEVIDMPDVSWLEKLVFDSRGLLQVKPYSFWQGVDWSHRVTLMHKHGIYCMPTTELIEYLRANITGKAIEIGAGVGAIGRELKIPITDSRMQELPHIMLYYLVNRQPVIKYPSDVERLDADEAMFKYRPDTVIGAYITHKWVSDSVGGNDLGPQEENIVARAKYIMIGNTYTHQGKPILKLPHKEEQFQWLVTRVKDNLENKIWTWSK